MYYGNICWKSANQWSAVFQLFSKPVYLDTFPPSLGESHVKGSRKLIVPLSGGDFGPTWGCSGRMSLFVAFILSLESYLKNNFKKVVVQLLCFGGKIKV